MPLTFRIIYPNLLAVRESGKIMNLRTLKKEMVKLIISFAATLAILIAAAKVHSFQKNQEEIKKKILEKARQVEQKIKSEREGRRMVEARKPMEVRIVAFLRKYEGVRFSESELREKIIKNYYEKVDFYQSLLAVTYYQRRKGYGFEVDYSKSKRGELRYYYEKPKE